MNMKNIISGFTTATTSQQGTTQQSGYQLQIFRKETYKRIAWRLLLEKCIIEVPHLTEYSPYQAKSESCRACESMLSLTCQVEDRTTLTR